MYFITCPVQLPTDKSATPTAALPGYGVSKPCFPGWSI